MRLSAIILRTWCTALVATVGLGAAPHFRPAWVPPKSLALLYVAAEGEETARASLERDFQSSFFLEYRLRTRVFEAQRSPGSELLKDWSVAIRPANAPTVLAAWRLIAGERQVLGSGEGYPKPDRIKQLLEESFGKSPLTRLHDFLRLHPDHIDARLDAVRALRPIIDLKLSLQKGRHSEGDLPEAVDREIWGECAHHLDQLFLGEGWAAGNGALLEMVDLPMGTPERRSPIMRTLYRRHRQTLVDMLRKCPENTEIWFALIRLQSALGEAFLPPGEILSQGSESANPVFLTIG